LEIGINGLTLRFDVRKSAPGHASKLAFWWERPSEKVRKEKERHLKKKKSSLGTKESSLNLACYRRREKASRKQPVKRDHREPGELLNLISKRPPRGKRIAGRGDRNSASSGN